MSNPGEKERREFFEGILIDEPQRPPPTHRKVETRLAEKLPVAPALPPRKLTERELKSLRKYEERVSRELRLFLRDVLAKLGSDQKFKCFARPVDEADVPDYYKVNVKKSVHVFLHFLRYSDYQEPYGPFRNDAQDRRRALPYGEGLFERY